MIKVLQLARDLDSGGLEKLIYDICNGIDKTLFDISVCCLHFKGEYGEALEKMGIRVQVLPFPKQVDYWSFLKVARVLRRLKPDILHTHNSHAFIDGTMAAIVAGRTMVVNTDHARNYPDRKRVLLAERVCAWFARRVVTVSEHTRNQLAEYVKIPKDRIRIIHNGIEASKYVIRVDSGVKRKELGICDFFPVLGLGVRLSRQKGIEYLLEAMPSLVLRFPKIVLLIAGKGELEQELRERAERLGVAGHVRFLGVRMDWNEILQLLDVYVLPSVWEGLPLAILEAMAARKPIVATSVGGVPSVIVHNEHGLLVSPKNPAQLSDAICTLLLDSVLATTLAGNAMDRFFDRFTLAQMVAAYEQLYLEIMEGKNTSNAIKR